MYSIRKTLSACLKALFSHTFFKQAFVWIFIASLIFPPQLVWAFVDYPEPVEAMDQIMTDLGMEKSEVRKSVADNNFSRLKKSLPTVTVKFVPESPVDKKELTATAIPANFTGNPEQMYYTWYLKHEECEKSEKEDKDYEKKCDLNEDDRVDEEDWKIEAMRLLANGGADPSLFDYSGDPDSDADDDGYDSVFGGEDQRWKPEHCYVKDIRSGIDYEMMFSENARVPGTNPEFHHYNPDGWEYEGRNAIAFVLCNDSPIIKSCKMVDTDGILPDFPLKKLVKPDGTPWLEKCREHFYEDVESFSLISHEQIVCLAEDNTEYVYGKGFINGDTWAFGAGFGICRCDEETPPEPDCHHLFPKKYYIDDDKIRIMNEDDEDLLVGNQDKGNFTTMEEKFWGTDPESKDTNNDGVPDEQALTGFGMMNFKWTYRSGDEIGVAVEGVTDNTDYEDSSMKTMWALPNTDFSNCEIEPYTPTESPESTSLSRDVVLGVDLNDCLEDNLIDPTQGTADTRIKVDLSYSPENPINDPDGNNSDKLKILANVANIEDKNFVKYSWEITPCVDAAGTICGSLTKEELSKMRLTKTEGLGIDSIEMDLKIEEESTQYLLVSLRTLETTLEASGKSGQGKIAIPLQHSQDRIIPHSISVIPLGSTSNMEVKLSQSDSRENLCNNKLCSAVKNEVIGLQFSGTANANNIYSWILDGKPMNATSNTAYFPVLKNPGSIYSVKLNITKKVSATDQNLTTDKITIARDFKVEDPTVEIVPGCEESQPDCTPPTQVELGRFIDPKYNTETGIDYSKDLFQAEKNTTVTLNPNFNFDSSILKKEDAQGNTTWRFTWSVDGVAINDITDPSLAQINPDGSLRLHINKPEGEKYTVSLETVYTQSGQIKKALTGIWNVPKENFYEKSIADSLEIEVADAPAATYQPGAQKILGSIFSGMPDYVNFLFRTVLTLALILFITNMSFALFPKQKL